MPTLERTIPTEALPVPNTRRQNRETFTRLFQGFVADFGNETAEKIIRHLVHDAGGLRLSIPGNNGDPLYGCSSLFRQLWINTCAAFGPATGRAIMMKIIVEFGGQRVWFPDVNDLCRIERNEKIRGLYNGANCQELAIRFTMHPVHIRRIARGEDD
jgi:hypothetical protein